MNRKTALAGILLAAALVPAGCSKKTAPVATSTAPQSIEFTANDIATVELGRVGNSVSVRGTLDPAQSVHVKAPMAGRLKSVRTARASQVRAGQTLATIDARTLQANSAGATAALASAERDLAAAEMLFKQGAIPRSDYLRAQAAVAAARAQSTGASQGVSDATITSPITGLVSESLVQPDETVMPGQPLFTIVNMAELEMVAKLPASSVRTIRVGQPAILTVQAGGEPVTGHVTRIEPIADPNTRLVSVFIHVPNSAHSVVPGSYAEGTIDTSPAGMQKLPIVPAEAVRSEDGQSFVYVIENGRLRRQAVTLGTRDDSRGVVEITSGLAAPARVVLLPDTDLKDGMAVTVPSSDRKQAAL